MTPRDIDFYTYIPQEWHIMVPALREMHPVQFPPRYSVGRQDSWVWQKLARPDPQFLNQYHLAEGGLMKTAMLQLKMGSEFPCHFLTRLPNEISEMIFMYLDESSVLSLAISSLTSAYYTLPYIERQILLRSAPWMNQPLACLGSLLTSLPPSFEAGASNPQTPDLTPADHKCLGDSDTSYSVKYEEPIQTQFQRVRGITSAARDYYWKAVSRYSGSSKPRNYGSRPALNKYQCLSELQNWVSELKKIEGDHFRSHQQLSVGVLKLLKDALCPSRFYGIAEDLHNLHAAPTSISELNSQHTIEPTENVWYLRNLTTKEYVRVSRCEEESKVRRTGFCDNKTQKRILGVVYHDPPRTITAECVMATRAQWVEPHYHDWHKPDHKKRSWAGDQFDMVTRRMHDYECNQQSRSRSPAKLAKITVDDVYARDDVVTTDPAHKVCSVPDYPATLAHGWRDVTEESIQMVMGHRGNVQ